MKTLATLIALSALGGTLALVGCDRSEETATPSAPPAAAAVALPANLVVAQAPANAQDLAAIKATAKDGDAVVVTGWVGGSESPIAKNRALLTLADKSLPNCAASPMDTCKTPWDSCCEPKDVITGKTATVQVVDAQGKPLAATLEAVAGLKPLSQVTVAGTARRPAGGDSLVIEAKEIHVTP